MIHQGPKAALGEAGSAQWEQEVLPGPALQQGIFGPCSPREGGICFAAAEMPEGELKWHRMGTGVARSKGRAEGLIQGTVSKHPHMRQRPIVPLGAPCHCCSAQGVQ